MIMVLVNLRAFGLLCRGCYHPAIAESQEAKTPESHPEPMTTPGLFESVDENQLKLMYLPRGNMLEYFRESE